MANLEHVRLLLGHAEETRIGEKTERFDLRGADLSDADLKGLRIHNVNLDGADLRRANLGDCQVFLETSLNGAKLDEAYMIGATMGGCSFTNASLVNAVLSFSHWTKVNLSGAVLKGARLERAQFEALGIDATDFDGAFAHRTTWLEVDLRGAKNLDKIIHLGPSSIGLDTILASQGRIPQAFLEGCGLPTEAIDQARSFGQSATLFPRYSCFISHSARDEEFCQRLYGDLRAAGVGCWYAPEHMKIGDHLRDEIQSAIGLHDKLLLVLSDNSVESDWVRSEVETAFQRESRERKQVLFPVRLDGAVMHTSRAWAADIQRQRHIGDFSGWKDHDSYKRAFDRLLRDLRAVPNA